MSRTVGKKNLHTIDIWVAYAKRLMLRDKRLVKRSKDKCPCWSVGIMVGSEYREVMNYAKFRKVIEFYFDRAKNAIIEGEAINMGGGVGKICAKRVERDFRRPRQKKVDWGKTNKLMTRDENNKKVYTKLIFFTADDWNRITWIKNKCITNETVYEFKPAGANEKKTGGFTKEFSEAQRKDPMLKYKYLFESINAR